MAQSTHTKNFKTGNKLSFGEEIGNAVSHGVMASLMLVLLPYAAIRGFIQAGPILAIGNSIFIIALFLMFLSSTLYHSMEFNTPHKYIFRILDHSFIYVAIAGSFTPIALMAIGGKLGITVVVAQWSMVIAGILYKTLSKDGSNKVSLGIYLVMGWSALILIPRLIRYTNPIFLSLIVLGGILYSIGAWFYAQKERPYFHFIWHLFINAASIAHCIAILFFMI